MPTIIDQLTIELGWDVRKFLEGAKQTEQIVRTQKDDFERQSKVWTAALTNLNTLLMKAAAAFLSIEAAIRGFEATRDISRTGAEFANLAEAVGMSVEQLGQWEQAMERVGGRAQDVGAAFKFQQGELQKTQTGLQGAPSFFGYMQRLHMPDWKTYLKPDGSYDLDRLNKDLADAMVRENLSPSTRAEILKGFGFDTPAAQRLFSEDLRRRLEESRPTAPTAANIETFRKLNELWAQLGQAADAVGRDLTTNLYKPIKETLDRLIEFTRKFDAFVKEPGVKSFVDTVASFLSLSPPSSGSGVSSYFRPGAGLSGTRELFGAPFRFQAPEGWRPGAVGQQPTGRAPPGPGTPSPGVPPPTGFSPWSTAPLAPPGWAPGAVGQQPTGRARPEPPATFEERWPSTPMPAAPAPPTFDERFPHKQSFLDGILGLTDHARYASAQPDRTSQTTTNSSVTIGGMTFNSRSSDTEMGFAPSGLMRELSTGQYALHFNTSIE